MGNSVSTPLGRRLRALGLARSRRQRGVQLDGAFASYASRPRLRAWPGGGGGGVRSWTESFLSTPLAANFGPGPEGAAEGGAAGPPVCFLRLSLPTSGLARRRRRRGTQLDGEFAFYASRRRLRAWPGGGGGGACSWTESLISTLAADFGPGRDGVARGARMDGAFAFYASRRRLRAWPGWGGGGDRSWTGRWLSTALAAAPSQHLHSKSVSVPYLSHSNSRCTVLARQDRVHCHPSHHHRDSRSRPRYGSVLLSRLSCACLSSTRSRSY